MTPPLTSFFASTSFIPHGFCLAWQPELLGLHVLSDSTIALAYYAIPFSLLYFALKRRDLVFRSIFALTGVFILACGTTHLMGVVTLWYPAYWIDGAIKLLTALVSIATVIAIWAAMPKALALPSTAQLEHANRRLQHEIGERQRAEETLRETNDELERRVAARIAERDRAEQTLRDIQANLAHAARLTTMGEFAGSIAHEVAQPITAMGLNAKTALRWLSSETPDVGEARMAIRLIVDDGTRAMNILQGIRALVRKALPKQEPIHIADMILEVLALTRSEFQRHGIALRTRLAHELPCILGDRIQLQQVMLNLVLNAIEAMAATRDGPRDLLIVAEEDGSDGVRVAVCDSGPGLAADAQANAFDAFYTTKPDGMGMGLSICRSIVEAHGGRIWVTGNGPRGAVFQFVVPFVTGRVSPQVVEEQ